MKETLIKKVVSERLGEHYFDISHKSGLRVFVFPKSFSTCFAVFGTRFGALGRKFTVDGKFYELPAGTAHFLEHKMFENADGTNSDELFAALGADDNAYTTYSTTRYIFSTTENEYECIAELVRMVQKPYFTKKTVKKEQGIIIQEIAMGDDSPWSCGMMNMLRGLYSNSYLRDEICGSEASVLQITDKTLYLAHKYFYSLSNMAFSIAGDITPEGVVEVLDRELDGISDTEPASLISSNEPAEIACEYTEKAMNVARPLFFFGFKGQSAERDSAERARRRCGMTVLFNMLFSSSSEFYNRMLREKLISPAFSFGYTLTESYEYAMFSGESDEPQRVRDEIIAKLKKAHAEGLSHEDFERCRRVYLAGYIRLFDSSEEIADDVVMNAWYSNVEPFSTLDTVDSLTLEYIEGLLADLSDAGHTLSVIKPKENI